jgi:hypothetical protein
MQLRPNLEQEILGTEKVRDDGEASRSGRKRKGQAQ